MTDGFEPPVTGASNRSTGCTKNVLLQGRDPLMFNLDTRWRWDVSFRIQYFYLLQRVSLLWNIKIHTVRWTDRKLDAQQCTVLLERSVVIWNIESLAECSTLTDQLIPWNRVLPEKLTGNQLIKFPAFYTTRRFSTAFTRARHLSHSWARSILSILSHSTCPAHFILHESVTEIIFDEK
jgi:hypothetical protein